MLSCENIVKDGIHVLLIGLKLYCPKRFKCPLFSSLKLLILLLAGTKEGDFVRVKSVYTCVGVNFGASFPLDFVHVKLAEGICII